MRLYLRTSPSDTIVPFAHLPMVTSALHRWLGPDNPEHDKLSLYSFSWLQGGRVVKGGLTFAQGAEFFISFYIREPLTRLVQGILADPDLDYGLRVTEVNIREVPVFAAVTRFQVASPVFIKRDQHDGKDRHILYSDPDADDCLTATLHHKLTSAGLDPTGANVRFDRSYTKAKTQLILYKNLQNKASFCPVIVSGTPEQVAFTWCVGVGNSTGIGFGSLI